MNQNYEKLKKDLENLIGKFNKGWHEGIEIDASDIMLLNDLMEALSAITNAPTVEQDSKPFGIWHVGETEDESDFFLYKDSGDVWEEGDIYLYTSPPKREWRGLSDEEINNLYYQSRNDIEYIFQGYTTKEQYFGRLLEAKLKELNHDRE